MIFMKAIFTPTEFNKTNHTPQATLSPGHTHAKHPARLRCALRRVVAAVALVLGFALPAIAQTANNAYIFYNGTYGYLVNNGGNPGVSTTFNKNAIWVANNTLNTSNNRNVRSYTDDTKYFTGSAGSLLGGNGTFSLGTSTNSWRINNNYLRYTNSTYGFVRYNGTGFFTYTSTADQNFTASAININTNNTTSNPILSISASNGLTNGGIQLTGSITGTYTPTYYYASVRNYNNNNTQTYYWTTTTDATTTNPTISDWSDATITWTVTTGAAYASVSSDGLVTITGNPTGNIVVKLTVEKSGYSGSETYTITRGEIAALNEEVTSDMTITPSSYTLDLGGTVTFTASPYIIKYTRTRPAITTLTAGSTTYYYSGGSLSTTEPAATESNPENIQFHHFQWNTDSQGYYSVGNYYSNSDNTTTLTRSQLITDVQRTHIISVDGYYGTSEIHKSTQATVIIPLTYADITSISCEGFTMSYGESRTLSPSTSVGTGAKYVNLKFTSNNENVLTVNQNGEVTAVGIGQTTITIQSYKINGDPGVSCTVYITVTKANLLAPTIEISKDGQVTITDNNPTSAGAAIYYTTDDSDPANSSTIYTGVFTVENLKTVKAIAIASANYNNSDVVSKQFIKTGISGTTLIINDYEDHNWTYYSGKPDTDYPDALQSPAPRNVKITYYANGYRHDGNTFTAVTGVQLSYNETANTFVYYETIEKEPGGQILTGNYPYKVIPNPFSKRPKNGNTYYGFEGWRIKSGGDKIANYNNNDILPLEQVINFINLDNGYSPNVISAEIELEAIWAPATVVTNSTANLTAGYSYERNFIVCNTNMTISNLAQNATVSSRYPDGTAYGNNNTTITGVNNSNTADIKVEHIKVSGTFYGANNKWLIVGRGCEGTIAQTLCNQANAKFRLESGTHSFVHPHPSTTGIMVFGSDYDRATADNSRLRIVDYVTANSSGGRTDGNKDEYMDITIKSGYYGYKSEYDPTDTYGNYGLGVGGNTDNINSYTPNGSSTTYNYNNGPSNKLMSFYCGGTHGGGTGGIIRVLIEGGELSSLNGGGTKNAAADNGVIMHHIRMKGGWVKGALYGTASATNSTGSARLVITGGEVNGWVAGACNGTRSDGNYNGELNGNCYIYVGGNAELRSHNNDGVYNNAWGLVFNVEGGTVFGAGKGIDNSQNHVGSANNTYISVSDEAYIEQAVYGGAFHGIAKESHIYLTGNAHVGNVYGGSFEPVHPDNEATWRCNNTDIRMYGGNVLQGIYGGHNAKGTVYGATSLHIDGGQVGTSNSTANIHGGGYGQNTRVNGNVDLTLGTSTQTTPGVTVYGDVYGGSALGTVNTDASNHTNVTLNKGVINGSLYGGALGDLSSIGTGHSNVEANVNGPVTVTVNGGTVNTTSANGSGAVYGCNNLNGAPQSTVTVDIYGTDPAPDAEHYALDAVYGGGNKASYAAGTPVVTVHNCDNSIAYVYGGGNAAHITNGNTDVTIYGGNKIGNVFGGGNGTVTAANVSGNTNVNIYGGTILKVFGGSNSKGTIGGTISVNVEQQTDIDPEGSTDACPINVGEVYGGGNQAPSNVGTVTIGCMGDNDIIDYVYGGSNDANITGDIDLLIKGGRINNVFGGNNTGHTISGSITVTVDWSQGSCTNSYLGNVFGGGNQAAYSGSPTVTLTKGTVSHNIYGGGNEAGVGGSTVNINGGSVVDGVYGGCNAEGTVGGKITVNLNGGTVGSTTKSADVYGGGLGVATATSGDIEVNLNGTTVYGDLYGGSALGSVNADGADPANLTKLTIGSNTLQGTIYGGGKGSNVGSGTQATSNGNVQIDYNTANPNLTGLYGGANINGLVKGNITVNVLANVGATGAGNSVNVFGGGLGQNTGTNGNVTVNVGDGSHTPEIYGDVYGGSALGNVNSDTEDYTYVNLNAGTIHGDVYGGGLGQLASAAVGTEGQNGYIPAKEAIAALVNGNVKVTQNGVAFVRATTNDNAGNPVVTAGRIFGCNNLNGSPQGTVLVLVSKTVPTSGTAHVEGIYEMAAVYGGGNLAAYNPSDANATGQYTENGHSATNKPVQVVIDGCQDVSIEYVYGGGNAAPTPATDIVILGAYEIGYAFGGGNGKDKYTLDGTTWKDNPGADVGLKPLEPGGTPYSGDNTKQTYGTGESMVTITGGTVHRAFGGSNTKGDVRKSATVYLSEEGSCPLKLDEVYGGGNEAVMSGGGNIILGCITYMKEIYGGAKQADVGSDVSLTITSGHFDRIFGGNNLGGCIKGSITVNIEETGCNPITIGELYGCGNKAAYSIYGYKNTGSDANPVWVPRTSLTDGDGPSTAKNNPTINIKSFTSIGNIYGGGLGKEAVVVGNPTVNINEIVGKNATVANWSYNGATITYNQGTADEYKRTIPTHTAGADKIGVIDTIYGGGNAAKVIGNTNVNIGTEKNITYISGSDHAEKTVVGADIQGNVYGGGNAADVTGKTNVKIGQATTGGSHAPTRTSQSATRQPAQGNVATESNQTRNVTPTRAQ